MAGITTYFRARMAGFGYAIRGIAILFRTQAHAQIHASAVVIITALGFLLDLHGLEWCAILLCMALVLLAEALNTALEFLVDLVSPDFHPLAGRVKDVAAGAVLLSVIFCGIVWGIIFLPKIFAFF